MLNYSAGSMLSLSWLRLWYGVFSEHGYPADNLYPGQESSCGAADWWRVCPEHKHYDGNLKTKQNMLCDGHSAREVIEQQHRDKQLLLSNGTSSIKFSYVRPLASSYRLLLDTSSYMGENQRWEKVRRALHRFIHLLPLGTVIRLVDLPYSAVREWFIQFALAKVKTIVQTFFHPPLSKSPKKAPKRPNKGQKSHFKYGLEYPSSYGRVQTFALAN